MRTNDGNILQNDIKLPSALEEILANPRADDLTLGDQFSGVELSDGSLENFVSNGGEDPFVVIEAEGSVDGGEVRRVGSGHDAKGEGDHLHIF